MKLNELAKPVFADKKGVVLGELREWKCDDTKNGAIEKYTVLVGTSPVVFSRFGADKSVKSADFKRPALADKVGFVVAVIGAKITVNKGYLQCDFASMEVIEQ